MLALLRLRNIGWPWAWVFLLLLPPASIWLGIVLCSYPPRFARHRRFDTAAKVIAGVIVILLVAAAMLTMIYWKQIQEEFKKRDARAAARP